MPSLEFLTTDGIALTVLAGGDPFVQQIAAPCAQRLAASGFPRHAQRIADRAAGVRLPGSTREPVTVRDALEDAADDPVVPGRLRRLCRIGADRLTHDRCWCQELPRGGGRRSRPCSDRCRPRWTALRSHLWQEALERA